MRGQHQAGHILSRVYNWTKAGNLHVSTFTRHIGHELQVSKLKLCSVATPVRRLGGPIMARTDPR